MGLGDGPRSANAATLMGIPMKHVSLVTVSTLCNGMPWSGDSDAGAAHDTELCAHSGTIPSKPL